MITLLNSKEALVEFNPSVDPSGAWEAPKAMTEFLDKHFNKCLTDEEREAIRKDSSGSSLATPKLNKQVKEHIRRKGKDSHFGSEKVIQGVGCHRASHMPVGRPAREQ